MLLKSQVNTVKASTKNPNIFACGTMKGKVAFGNSSKEPSEKIGDKLMLREFYNDAFPTDQNALFKEKYDPKVLLPDGKPH